MEEFTVHIGLANHSSGGYVTMISKSKLEGLYSDDVRALDLLRQVMRSQFTEVGRLFRQQRGEQAADLLTELADIVQMIVDRIADLREIDHRRNVELIMLMEKVKHYEFELFDALSSTDLDHDTKPPSHV